jgi:hypothetical protein
VQDVVGDVVGFVLVGEVVGFVVVQDVVGDVVGFVLVGEVVGFVVVQDVVGDVVGFVLVGEVVGELVVVQDVVGDVVGFVLVGEVVGELVGEDVGGLVGVLLVDEEDGGEALQGSLDSKSLATYKFRVPLPPQVSEESPVQGKLHELDDRSSVPLPKTTPQ